MAENSRGYKAHFEFLPVKHGGGRSPRITPEQKERIVEVALIRKVKSLISFETWMDLTRPISASFEIRRLFDIQKVFPLDESGVQVVVDNTKHYLKRGEIFCR